MCEHNDRGLVNNILYMNINPLLQVHGTEYMTFILTPNIKYVFSILIPVNKTFGIYEKQVQTQANTTFSSEKIQFLFNF